MINGISEFRWNRLIYHLETLERETGQPLLVSPRHPHGCPIECFAPSVIRVNGRIYRLSLVTPSGRVHYYNQLRDDMKTFFIYEKSDSKWWVNLSMSTKNKVLLGISEYLEHKYGR